MADAARLRPLRPLRPAGRLRPRVLRRGRRVRAGLPGATCRPGRRSSRCRWSAGAQGVDTVGPLDRTRRAPTPSSCSSQESMMLPVPNGLPPDVAALTEPMAVAWHAVRRGEVRQAPGRDRDRLRAGRARRDPHAQGPGRAHRRRQRLLARPPRAGAGLRRRRRRRSRRGLALHGRRRPRPPDATRRRRSSCAVDTREKLERLPVDWWHVVAAGREARRRAQASRSSSSASASPA